LSVTNKGKITQDIPVLKSAYIKHNIHNQKKEFVDQKQKYYLSLIKKELAINSNNTWLLFQKAKTNFYLNNFDEALIDLTKIINLKNIDDKKIFVGSYILCALIFLTINKNELAIEYLNKSLQIKKSTAAYVFLGDISFKNKDYKSAMTYYLKLSTKANFLYKDNMFLVSYIENSEKIYKISSCLLCLNLNIITVIYILLQKKKHLSASTFYLLSISFYKIKRISLSKKYLNISKQLDPLWINEFNY